MMGWLCEFRGISRHIPDLKKRFFWCHKKFRYVSEEECERCVKLLHSKNLHERKARV
jgi:hypothetical protein